MSTARLYVGNINYGTTKETLEKTFAEHGEVAGVNIITDRQTGRPKGFAFVEMATPEAAEAAKAALNGLELDGRTKTAISMLSAQEREHEIASLLSGDTVSDASLESARELLKQPTSS